MTDDELTRDELSDERGALLPEREAMSIISPNDPLPMPPIPFDPPPDGDLPPLVNDTDPPPDRWP